MRKIQSILNTSLLASLLMFASAVGASTKQTVPTQLSTLSNHFTAFVYLDVDKNNISQDTSKKRQIEEVPAEIFIESDDSTYKEAEFIGGDDSLYAFLSRNIQFPAEMKGTGQKALVVVEFVVETSGTVSNVKATECECAEAFKNTAIKLIQMSSRKWFPASQNGKPIRSICRIPIGFEQ